MKLPITDGLKRKIFLSLLAAGVSPPVAFVAVEHTVPSEGFLTNLHNDPVGLPSACIGHLIKKGETPKKEYTVDECIDMFVKDWTAHQEGLNKLVKVEYTSQWQEGALTDFTFNKGIASLQSSTLLKKLNNKEYDAACEQLTRWVYGRVNGVLTKLPGLVIRASKQYSYCMGEEPATYKTDMIRWTVNE